MPQQGDALRYGLEEGKKILLHQLQGALAGLSGSDRSAVVVRVKVPLMDIDPVRWLACQKHARKVYWRSPEGNLAVAGIGAAFEISSDGWYALDDVFAQVQEITAACPQARVFAGMSFNRAVSAVEWKGFPAMRFILPAVEVVRDSDGVFLAVNVVRGHDDASAGSRGRADLEQVRFFDQVNTEDILPVAREDVPDHEDWIGCAQEALECLERGEFQKIVLARRMTLELGGVVAPEQFLEMLLARQKNDFGFLFAAGEDAFFGVSPEPLYSRRGLRVESRTISGVCPRGRDAAHDEKLSVALLKSDKGLRGHNLAAGAMIEVFRQFCRSYQVDCEPEILRRAHEQHLCMRLSGMLSEGISDKEFLQALHPSPVVAGVPAEKARLFLQQHEVFDRGWFGGPVGFISRDHTELAVAGRACLLEGTSLHAYAAAPLVIGSVPLEAWEAAGAGMKDILDSVHRTRP